MSLASKLLSASGGGADKLYVDDVFSAYTYTGNGATQTINNGIDLAGKGGLVWIRLRNASRNHILVDSARGNYRLISNSTAAQTTPSDVSLLGNGFSITNTVGDVNNNTSTFVSWTFRKAPKFFDAVTYTGNGANRVIAHSLGQEVGMILIKRTDTTSDWQVYHRSLANTEYMVLNSTAVKATGDTRWNSTTPTTSVFSLGTDASVNASGGSYVAYAFAHDPSADGIIQCGSYAGNGSVFPTINLGWEPQFLMVKRSSGGAGSWQMLDVMRGINTGSIDATLQANSSASESMQDVAYPTATGFQIESSSTEINTNSSTYIYLAIRRPNKPPTTGTRVYNAIARTGTGADVTVTGVGFAPDLYLPAGRSSGSNYASMFSRLTGNQRYLIISLTAGEQNDSNAVTAFNIDGVSLGTDSGSGGIVNTSGSTYINHFFKRAPGVFDVVCYTGTGVARTVDHSLGVAPGLMIVKTRSGSGEAWIVGYASSPDAATILALNSTNGNMSGNPTIFNSTRPTSSVLSLGTATNVNANTATYVAYLFATKPGISKVGSYTGNGSSQTIPCGFTTGARFILIKRTNTTGDWYVWDTARGVVAGNDPHLSLNTTAAEVTTNDSIDPDPSGFIVNQVAATNINVSGGTYIFLAIA